MTKARKSRPAGFGSTTMYALPALNPARPPAESSTAIFRCE
ncbi:hypothetical protein [Streptomyces sp. NBC_01443]|nr:hypothetical protein [Streptomyces sp. NBC_01443]MCX4632156.1 hypothetical protein [Streptomyces sp. NBC_01443]WSW47973.1 hypothetical protein OG296_35515 [Streptomyces sp. NBC_01001]